MKKNRKTLSSTVWTLILAATLLTGFPRKTPAQTTSPTNTPPTTTIAETTPAKATRNKRQFVSTNKKDWNIISSRCSGATITDSCAQAAIVKTTTECGGSARFFQRSSTAWQITNLVLILSSAAFTAVGASTTIANAKIFSTLGGTTGLGATTTTINANASADQTGLASVNTTLANFLTFLKTGAVPGESTQQGAAAAANTPPDNATIFKLAPVFAAQCEAAATGSSGK
jgi:hypothetical protein